MKLMLHTPVGLLLAEYESDALRSLRFWRTGEHPPAGTRDEPTRTDGLGRRLAVEIDEYFDGGRRTFDLPLRAAATPFQAAIREALRRIPYGEVRSYGEIAAAVGRPGAARAVGQANARNPFPVVVPCHRVLASGGQLGGYMGEWGRGEALGKKEWLLRHEGAKLPASGVLSLGF
jgi:methylated-DNA-[protein]-cysteine S-methyltransferase